MQKENKKKSCTCIYNYYRFLFQWFPCFCAGLRCWSNTAKSTWVFCALFLFTTFSSLRDDLSYLFRPPSSCLPVWSKYITQLSHLRQQTREWKDWAKSLPPTPSIPKPSPKPGSSKHKSAAPPRNLAAWSVWSQSACMCVVMAGYTVLVINTQA